MSKRSDPDLEYLDAGPSKFILDLDPQHRVSSVDVSRLQGRIRFFFIYQNNSGRMSNKLSCLRFVCICVAVCTMYILTF
jgi:hypothetical protein